MCAMARSGGATRVLTLLASAIRVVASVIAAVIVVHAVFVLFGANPANALVQFSTSWRDTFGWFTKNLFRPSNPKLAEAINDGLAALIYVLAGNLLSRLVLRITPAGAKA